jgi:Domain of Unknown Function (DUF1080)
MQTTSPFNPLTRRAGATLLVLLGSWLMLGPLPAAETAPTGTPLFNGRNLDGWYVYLQDRPTGALQDIVQVNDGVIHLYKDAAAGTPQPFGYLSTRAEYSDYHLTLEYQWGTKKFAPRAGADTVRDAGVCYHVLAPDMIWPTAVECQIQEGDTGDVWLIHTRATSHVHPDNMNYWTADQTGGVDLTKGDNPKGYQRFLRSYCYEQPGWNRVELIVRGDTATYLVNGHIANRVTGLKHWDAATASWQPLTKGKILLQAEGAEIFYRNITLQSLKTPPGS